MMRDGVCDEAANIANCLYDGGDCCLENKDRTLCRNCTCRLIIDKTELRRQFKELEIKPAQDPDSLKAVIVADTAGKIVVEDVVSSQVCAALCLEHEKADQLNSWHYEVDKVICRCGWVHSALCPHTMVTGNWTLKAESTLENSTDIAFVQLNKTVLCGR